MIRALALLAAVLAAVAAVQGSQATFTGSAQNSGGSFATATDWVAPTVTLTTPSNGSFTNDNTPTLAGAAGNGTGDSTTVTVRIYSGSSATGTPVQTLTPTRNAATWTATAATLANGTYTAKATQADGSGNTGSSSAVTFTVDTAAPTATAIAAANKGGTGTTAGKLDAGDAITYTFSEAISPASILNGWSGASTAVRVRFNAGSPNDTFTVLDSSGGSTVKLGTVTTNGDYVSATTSIASSTMVRSADGKSIVVTLGTPSNVSPVAVTAKNMSWALAAGPKDLAGNAVATPATRAETDADVDF
jgi:Bacterial Ig-like domain